MERLHWLRMVGLVAAIDSGSAASSLAQSVVGPTVVGPAVVTPAVKIAAGHRMGDPCPQCGKVHARSSVVSNVLSTLNAQRARQGLASLRYDHVLQAVAERRARQMAASGQKGHPPGSFAPGRYEGVGWSSTYSPTGVSACYTSDPRMREAGAAMAAGRDGVYFVVVYR